MSSHDKPRDDHRSQAERVMAEILEKVGPPKKAPKDCEHPDFAAGVAIARLEDSGVYVAELRVCCVVCHVPMRFVGLGAGFDPFKPLTSIDGLELNAPIEPELEKELKAGATYRMPAIPVRH